MSEGHLAKMLTLLQLRNANATHSLLTLTVTQSSSCNTIVGQEIDSFLRLVAHTSVKSYIFQPGFCKSGKEQGLLQEVPGQIQEEER